MAGNLYREVSRSISLGFRPYRASAMLPVFASVPVLISVPFTNWTHRSLITLTCFITLAIIHAVFHHFYRDRLPPSIISVDIILYDAFITALCVLQPSANVDFSVLYIWTAIFVALYFPAVIVGLHLGLISVGYAIILWIRPGADNPVNDWLPVVGSAVALSAVVAILVNVLRRASTSDALTGLANRRSWDDRLDEELARAQRGETTLSLAMIDIDNFKAVNDHDGHAAGDLLLRQFAAGWQEVVREGGDFLARLGGDEFGVLLPGINEVGVQRLAERLQGTTPGGISCSVGVVTWDGVESAGDLTRRADEAMFQVKRDHRAG